MLTACQRAADGKKARQAFVLAGPFPFPVLTSALVSGGLTSFREFRRERSAPAEFRLGINLWRTACERGGAHSLSSVAQSSYTGRQAFVGARVMLLRDRDAGSAEPGTGRDASPDTTRGLASPCSSLVTPGDGCLKASCQVDCALAPWGAAATFGRLPGEAVVGMAHR